MAATEKKITPSTYVGFDSITKQIQAKLVQKSFPFNIMVVGRSGLGKSTMVNTIFDSQLVESKGVSTGKTVEINTVTNTLEEKGIKLQLSITDTPGFGDMVNNEACWEPVVKYIKDQYSIYLRKELTPERERIIPDTRIHVVLYFIAPTGHSLTPLDITVMKKIAKFANVVPVIGKSDSFMPEELLEFKKRVKAEIEYHGIRIYPQDDVDKCYYKPGSEEEKARMAQFQILKDMIPFAVVGFERNIFVDGKAIRGRRTRVGVINVEDETHCEFSQLRNFLIRTHLQDLIDSTIFFHYEGFRARQLLALREYSASKATEGN